MKDYFVTLLTASLLGGIIAALVSGSSFEKYIKYIAGLVCVVIIIAPLKSFITAPFKLPDEYADASVPDVSVTGADEVIGELTVSELDSYIKDILFREFGIKVPLTDIKIDWADDCMIINEITVFIESKDGGHKDDVEKYLEDIIDESIMVEIL
ncbi:MAG: stage III sporulation protein AF [Eubacteriales bacterium]|nr:stage III sporulation protein AF [Eubacteriales bacterium]MDD4421974.1 stage III sporulation protein AF [Eubacteriales bacterium]HBR31324.1 hypothetical protein [Clostridiales bacterium]